MYMLLNLLDVHSLSALLIRTRSEGKSFPPRTLFKASTKRR
jgi:hypothetical protein